MVSLLAQCRLIANLEASLQGVFHPVFVISFRVIEGIHS